MILVVECIFLCICFTMMIFIIAKNPIKTLYNYPPKVQEKVKSLNEYKDKVPSTQNKILAKCLVAIFTIILMSLILRYINGCQTFEDALFQSFIIWTVVNLYDVFIIDICWFCQDKRFIFPGTEDIKAEYKNYWFHVKEGIVGQIIGTIICILAGLIVQFIL